MGVPGITLSPGHAECFASFHCCAWLVWPGSEEECGRVERGCEGWETRGGGMLVY